MSGKNCNNNHHRKDKELFNAGEKNVSLNIFPQLKEKVIKKYTNSVLKKKQPTKF